MNESCKLQVFIFLCAEIFPNLPLCQWVKILSIGTVLGRRIKCIPNCNSAHITGKALREYHVLFNRAAIRYFPNCCAQPTFGLSKRVWRRELMGCHRRGGGGFFNRKLTKK